MEHPPTPCNRNSALALLSTMAATFPAAMASRLRTLLEAVCFNASSAEGMASGSVAGGFGGKVALRQTQKAIQSIVPALRTHGAEAGIGAHFVVQVCRVSTRVFFPLGSYLDVMVVGENITAI